MLTNNGYLTPSNGLDSNKIDLLTIPFIIFFATAILALIL